MNPLLIIIFGGGILGFLFIRIAFWLYRHGEKEREAMNKLGRSGVTPDSFTLKGDPAQFFLAVLTLCAYIGAGCMFGFLLRRATIHYTPGFLLGVALFGTISLIELWRAVIIFCYFFKGRLHVEGTQMVYTDWLGHPTTFDIHGVVSHKQGWVGINFIIEKYSCLRYQDPHGRERIARLNLSTYSRTLLDRYLNDYGTPQTGDRRRENGTAKP